MREIKFRAWSSGRKEMTEVESIHFKGNAVYLISKYLRLVANLDETELMQYTGQKDINRQEIYESDILKIIYQEMRNGYYHEEEFTGIVTFEDAAFIIKCNKNGEEYHFNFNDVDISMQEKIGNIYENPELLEVK